MKNLCTKKKEVLTLEMKRKDESRNSECQVRSLTITNWENSGLVRKEKKEM